VLKLEKEGRPPGSAAVSYLLVQALFQGGISLILLVLFTSED